jgi:branched-chain amino acid aminotransferase
VPIKSITCRSKNDKFEYLTGDEPGPVCVKLLTTLKGVQQGKIADQWGWLDRVPEPKGFAKSNGVEENKTIDELP